MLSETVILLGGIYPPRRYLSSLAVLSVPLAECDCSLSRSATNTVGVVIADKHGR